MRISLVEYELPNSIRERFQTNPEVFAEILQNWGISAPILEKMEIIIEIRDMILDGAFGGRKEDTFLIYLAVDLFRPDLAELNAVIAHELKHLWYLIMMPNERLFERTDGFWVNKRKSRWEEKECKRMEKKYATTPFITLT